MLGHMEKSVCIVGAGLAGSEAALQLACRGVKVRLVEMRPRVSTAVHISGNCAELVCSNSLKSMNPATAAGMMKYELSSLGSILYEIALQHRVPAGGALALEREAFSAEVTSCILAHPLIDLVRDEANDLAALAHTVDALLVATGPLTSDALAADLLQVSGQEQLSFYDAAAPIVMADSLNYDKLFWQSRYESAEVGQGDYLNAPLDRCQYNHFIEELTAAKKVIAKDFETRELFQACQPIEEVARKGQDAPRFGALKPVGLVDPRTEKRPWAAVQLRAENTAATSYNLVGFQTNLTFSEQQRIFRLIPGLERAEFARYGVMHRNTFLNAPYVLDESLRLCTPGVDTWDTPVFVAGQLAGTEGYAEAIRSGLHGALSMAAYLFGLDYTPLSPYMAFGALMGYATNPATKNYQPMHVSFGLLPELDQPIRSKRDRALAYAKRGVEACDVYRTTLQECGLFEVLSKR